MHASQITETMIVKRSRFFSATEAPPIDVDMPPPKRSDMPPPRPLCISTKRDRTTLVRTNTIEKIKIGKRLYDVIVENTTVLPAHDIAYDVGTFIADDHTFYVEVLDNRMDVRFVPRAGATSG